MAISFDNHNPKITKCCLCNKSLLTEWKTHDKCSVTRDVLIKNGAKDIPTSGYSYHTFKEGKKAVYPVCSKCYDKAVKKTGKDPKKPDNTIKTTIKKTKEPVKVPVAVKKTTKKK
jgi:hypothetical protein